MNEDKKQDITFRMTAREFLVYAGGPKHVDHSVIAQTRVNGSFVDLTCSCGMKLRAASTKMSTEALRNVPEVKL